MKLKGTVRLFHLLKPNKIWVKFAQRDKSNFHTRLRRKMEYHFFPSPSAYVHAALFVFRVLYIKKKKGKKKERKKHVWKLTGRHKRRWLVSCWDRKLGSPRRQKHGWCSTCRVALITRIVSQLENFQT